MKKDELEYFLPATNDAYLYEEYFQEILKKCLDFYSGKTRSGKVLNYKSEKELIAIVSEDLPIETMPLKKSLDLFDIIGKYSISQSDQNFLAFPDSGNSVPALGAAIYTNFINQNMIAFDRSSPIGTFIEIQVIEWFRRMIGFDGKPISKFNTLEDMAGLWTSGGAYVEPYCNNDCSKSYFS